MAFPLNDSEVRDLTRTVSTLFQASAINSKPLLWYQDLVEEVGSSGFANVYPVSVVGGDIEEWVGGDAPYSEVSDAAFQVTNKRFARGVRINLDNLKDKGLGYYQQQINAIGSAFALWPQRLLAKAIRDNAAGPDGLALFHDAHPTNPVAPDGGVNDNNLAGLSLTEANLTTALANMVTFKGSDGQPLGLMGTHLLVPPARGTDARKLVTAQYGTAGSSNVLYGRLQPIEGAELAAAFGGNDDAWFMVCSMPGKRPFVRQLREALKLVTTLDEERNEIRYLWTERSQLGIAMPVAIIRGAP